MDGPASVASRQAFASVIPNLIPSFTATHLEPFSWWPEPMDLDPPGLLVFTPLNLRFDLPPSRWPEPMEF